MILRPLLRRWFSWFPTGSLLCLLFVANQVQAAPGDSHWDRQFEMPGTHTRNFALAFNGGRLYTGGYEIFEGQLASNTFAGVFNGTNWDYVGPFSADLAVIYDFGFLGEDVYVGGIFQEVDGIPAEGLARWDGKDWTSVGGLRGAVLAMVSDGTNLYVGGSFEVPQVPGCTNVARWDGKAWSPLKTGVGFPGGLNSAVHALALHDGMLYVGGTFTNAGSVPAKNLARWDGASWAEPGGGITGSMVGCLHVVTNDLYVGGRFTAAGDVPVLNIARWDGANWSALGNGLKAPNTGDPVGELDFMNGYLYATGNFTNAGGLPATRVARWNGTAWENIGGLNDIGTRVVAHEGSVYFAGTFNFAGDVVANHVARFDGANWHPVHGRPAHGTHLFVNTLAAGQDGIYMGGSFSAVGGVQATNVARWDGANCHPLGGGISGRFKQAALSVRGIDVTGADVFVGGAFVNAGNITANNIARWDGSSWHSLGAGTDFTVNVVEVTPTLVYVGGGFTNVYNSTDLRIRAPQIASWDAVNGWQPLGTGVAGFVGAICAVAGKVYVGGSFRSAGTIMANRIAVWDGAQWDSLGTGTANGLGGTVNAILVEGSDVYVGGAFTTAGGIPARGIAKWSGNEWSAVGSGVFAPGIPTVYSMLRHGSYLYVGGTFTNVNGVLARNIARWDGTRWENLGSGVGWDAAAARVVALATHGDDLLVAGIFETAGAWDAGYVARWNETRDFTPAAVLRIARPQVLPNGDFKFHLNASRGASYTVEYSRDLMSWTEWVTHGASSLDLTNHAPQPTSRFFRLKQVE